MSPLFSTQYQWAIFAYHGTGTVLIFDDETGSEQKTADITSHVNQILQNKTYPKNSPYV